MSRLIVLKPTAPNSTPWIPGTMGLYPGTRPKAAPSPNTSAWQNSFPLWKVRVDALKLQPAMFQIADNISSNAFYIAADDWTKGDGQNWGIGKRYGAFSNATEFVTIFLEIAQHWCFYEIIRSGCPSESGCKANLDLEAESGAMSDQEGEAMCAAVNREWKQRVTSRWPAVVEQCKQSLESRSYDSHWQ